jgi:hypothetical protein
VIRALANRKIPMNFPVIVKPSFSTVLRGNRTFQVGQFCENLGDIPECPLFSKAV